jgi:hypothetical protein
MNQHSRAPFLVMPYNTGDFDRLHIVDADRRVIGEVYPDGVREQSRQQSNALLWAAAPELLAYAEAEEVAHLHIIGCWECLSGYSCLHYDRMMVRARRLRQVALAKVAGCDLATECKIARAFKKLGICNLPPEDDK